MTDQVKKCDCIFFSKYVLKRQIIFAQSSSAIMCAKNLICLRLITTPYIRMYIPTSFMMKYKNSLWNDRSLCHGGILDILSNFKRSVFVNSYIWCRKYWWQYVLCHSTLISHLWRPEENFSTQFTDRTSFPKHRKRKISLSGNTFRKICIPLWGPVHKWRQTIF